MTRLFAITALYYIIFSNLVYLKSVTLPRSYITFPIKTTAFLAACASPQFQPLVGNQSSVQLNVTYGDCFQVMAMKMGPK